MRKFLIMTVAALLLASACQKSEENPESPSAAAPEVSAPTAEASAAPAWRKLSRRSQRACISEAGGTPSTRSLE
jgi:hypothetical protein